MCIREDLESHGCQRPPIKPKGSHFGSNYITPGTEFMARLAVSLQYYTFCVHPRLHKHKPCMAEYISELAAGVDYDNVITVLNLIERMRKK